MMPEVERGGVRVKDGRRVKNITLSCNNLFDQLHAYYRASQIYYKSYLYSWLKLMNSLIIANIIMFETDIVIPKTI